MCACLGGLLLFSREVSSEHTAALQASLSSTISQSFFKLTCTEIVMLSNHLILSPPSPAISLSQHQGVYQ